MEKPKNFDELAKKIWGHEFLSNDIGVIIKYTGKTPLILNSKTNSVLLDYYSLILKENQNDLK